MSMRTEEIMQSSQGKEQNLQVDILHTEWNEL